ncbi:flippase [Patescibacteria group bacterium]|nr:flippase [Patescibacteria group bacterium]MCL5733217.1 flippase [Patescibacteria group bacterium]
MREKIKNFLFKNKTTKQTIAKNTFWLSFGNGGSKLIRAIVIIYAARILGAANYGIFAYATSLAAFFTVFSDIGLSQLLTRELAANSERQKEYISTTFYIKLFLLVLTILLIIFVAPYFTKIKEARVLLPIIAFLLVFDNLRTFGFSVTRAYNRMELEGGLMILTEVFVTSLSLFVLFRAPSDFHLVLAYTIGSFLGFLATFTVIRQKIKDAFSHFRKALVKEIISSAWSFAILGLFGSLMLNVDVIIIGWFKDAIALGLYAASQKPILILYILPGLLSTSLFPIMVKLAREKQADKMKMIMEKTMAIIFAAAIPAVVGGLIVAPQLIRLLFGAQYTDATLAFQILLFTFLLVFPGAIFGNFIFAYDQQKIFLISIGIGSLINVVFDLLLIPSYSISGSAVATLLSQLFANGYTWWKAKKIIPFGTLKNLPKIFLASMVMGIACWFLVYMKINVLINVAVSAAIYFAALFVLREKLIAEIKSVFKV